MSCSASGMPIGSLKTLVPFRVFFTNLPHLWRKCYERGYREPRFLPPAIPLRVVMNDMYTGYKDMIYIDDVSDPDDPHMVCAWDFYTKGPAIGKHGTYTRVYE